MEKGIEICGLTKKYKEQTVLNNITVEFKPNEIAGLVGRNGSGKTMLLKSICGFVRPTSGTIRINGEFLNLTSDVTLDMGILIENPGFLPNYSAYENLKILAMIQGNLSKKDIMKAMDVVDLDINSHKKVGKFSMGMKQKLGIAQAILGEPQIILLDEPMNSLDMRCIEKVRSYLIEIKRQERIIILASHSKEDIEMLCDNVYTMEFGQLK